MKRTLKKIILIPYPAQGHVTPMLKFAAVLSNLGTFQPVVVTPEFIHRRISPRINPNDGILCHSIPDGIDDGAPRDFFAIERAMEEYMPRPLEKYVREMIENEDGGGVACVVVDLLASWAVEVARRCDLEAVGFWPAMHATYRLVAAIPHLIRNGVISENGCPRNLSDPIYLSSNAPILTTNDLPWLIGSSQARVSRFKFWTRTLQRAKTLPYILTNSFIDESNHNKCDPCESPQVLEIGPLIMETATMNSATFWDEDVSCLDWLDKQNVGSVMYISFGSWVSPIGEGKVISLALTLEALRWPFIWVLGPAWRRGLPDGFDKRVAAYGRVVSWVPQLEVLQHQAVGCYLTHCGWNSTVEAIQCKKPLLCYPIAGDQFLNCAYIVNVWKIGMKMERFGIEEMENGIKEVMGSEEMNQRIKKVNDKLFGKEGSTKAMANLSTFIKDIGRYM